jgi:hypothetical protein
VISFNFNLRNPRRQEFKNLWNRSWHVFKNKYIELEFYKDSSMISVGASWTVRQSHAGLDMEFGLLGYCVHFNFYDNRHWNHKEGRWMFYTEEEGLH